MLCRTVAEGVVARVDAGLANDRIFLLMASCGFDANVVHRVHQRRTGHINISTYFKPVAEAIWSYEFPKIQVHWEEDGETPPQLSARWLFVFNMPCYGGGFRIAPHADSSDGLLDVCSFRRGHFWPGLGYVAALLLRRHQRMADWTTHRVRRLRITSDAPVPYQLDGDPGGFLPLDIQVLPGRLTLIVPREAVRQPLIQLNEQQVGGEPPTPRSNPNPQSLIPPLCPKTLPRSETFAAAAAAVASHCRAVCDRSAS